MNKTLKEEYIRAIFRFKKAGMIFPKMLDVNIRELAILTRIVENSPCSDNNIGMAEMVANLHITKPAISQIMNSLEKRGYIERKKDKVDRRKVVVILTQDGMNVLNKSKEQVDKIFEEIISRFGEDNTKQMISLIEKLAEVSEELEAENN